MAEQSYLFLGGGSARVISGAELAPPDVCLARLKELFRVLSDPEAITMARPAWEDGRIIRSGAVPDCQKGFCPYIDICKEVGT